MKITQVIENVFKKYLPSPFTIAILLTFITILLALVFTKPVDVSIGNYSLEVLRFWENGIWSNGLLVFAYQMMLILVLGHVLVLSKPVSSLILRVTKYCTNTANSAVIVSVTTMLVSFFNWGLGLIFGALLARKVGEHAQRENIKLNYPIIGAAGYVGLMVWHGGISGSAPIKINEEGHIKSIMSSVSSEETLAKIPSLIDYSQTVFSWWNLLIFVLVLLTVSVTFYFLGRKAKPTNLNLPEYIMEDKEKSTTQAEKLDNSKVLSIIFGVLILVAFFYQYSDDVLALKITPNLINFFMFGLGILLHGSFKKFTNAVGESISDVSGILIQFPLYFGIMGIMKSAGMVTLISDFFVSVSTATTLPIFTFFSAGLVNIFVPSGGGQWVVQGPIVVESALQLGVPLPKAIMALAYGDQITNMLQPFWALPLLGITKLKAKEILPYTLIAMVVGSAVYLLGLLVF
ncbi:short-chain fatty acid transporter [Tenacibaculum holothuriorum]|uniref:Short-chain fatty acid transporter n=1 Tax=Tenacibaculum holothuriorum TaxID=1635173 RepID=A0A1Y2P9W0_9FLAO|nr:TIGR00366 family protein [Tenacibaculum holothuriorum]OSY87226.1 short-chain fatty acid transporter [Tenacibaculum holothuriorum]